MKFHTDYIYTDRETKARYVWQKYHPILKGRILDVGSDECYLKQYLSKSVEYIGIGLGGNPDQQVDLEKEKIPFDDCSFDCVLCLDVLEHLDNLHEVFDELCRVSKKYVIISLPNPWSSLLSYWRNGDYHPGQAIKFYGLPLEKPVDRHKWFFSLEEADRFIQYRANKNFMRCIQIDNENTKKNDSNFFLSSKIKSVARLLVTRLLISSMFMHDFSLQNLSGGTLWVVLEHDTCYELGAII